ncbi:hypothetical protein TVAG_347790 [Trichomonas vaginalis G3]|uniref:Uncharacterized protein n=1 Tax=Trichomonas vaginalis (strain ATCC PRA-98 / G3) TaxID=412133 RepID=A2DSS0_TRIV3|nr:pollen tube development protein family [Trichomonas vaginalis G3]EAY16469.1 hypothetical protein TVAG_347790 [Trichomonas vaginalis G3]KAI5493605.1 pollen tube development protein family [Trichomonas vaginalis G3]|eukprot:XP_001328692.1 hypothetical protein [Trichomonas vaginalis G3]
MLLKLIILVLIAVLIYFILKFSVKSILSSYAEVQEQKGIFSYEHIQFKNKGVNVILKDVSLFINPIAFFTNSIYLLWFDAKSIAVDGSSIESSQTDKPAEKEEKEPDYVHTTLLTLFGYSIIKRIHLSIENLILSLQIFDLSINARGLVNYIKIEVKN